MLNLAVLTECSTDEQGVEILSNFKHLFIVGASNIQRSFSVHALVGEHELQRFKKKKKTSHRHDSVIRTLGRE